MSRKEKLKKRLLAEPKDFSWDELTTLLRTLGFESEKQGKTRGSRRRFSNKDNVIITLHRPHPHNHLKRYQVKQIIETLKEESLL